MIVLRRSSERGFADHGWLKSWHSFSFADYFDPKHMGFRQLRVINQDQVAPSQGFPMHGHRDMEIVTIVVRGCIQHQDSMGNHVQIPAGDIQKMSAGTGVRHSEYNPSSTEELELFQIWIEPAVKGLSPSYEQASFDKGEPMAIRLLAGPSSAKALLSIEQDVKIYYLKLAANEAIELPVTSDRFGWLQIYRGSLQIAGHHPAEAGDGLALSREQSPTLLAGAEGLEAIFFDLA